MVARADDAPKKLDPWLFIRRGLRLRCPECGISPIFIPARRVRSIWDWFTPLDGCPRCGYAYDREQGYCLLATWGVHYFTVAGSSGLAALKASVRSSREATRWPA